MNMALVLKMAVHPLRQLFQDMAVAVVDDGMDGVQPQAVEVELLQPIERVVDEEVAYRPAALAVDGE